MKKTMGMLVLATVTMASLYAFSTIQSTGIKGEVDPPAMVTEIRAIDGKDTVRTTAINGVFLLSTKPGVWKLEVSGKAPYKTTVVERVTVTDGKLTDAGVIKLTE